MLMRTTRLKKNSTRCGLQLALQQIRGKKKRYHTIGRIARRRWRSLQGLINSFMTCMYLYNYRKNVLPRRLPSVWYPDLNRICDAGECAPPIRINLDLASVCHQAAILDSSSVLNAKIRPYSYSLVYVELTFPTFILIECVKLSALGE